METCDMAEENGDSFQQHYEIEKVEHLISELLHGAVNLLDIVKGVRYANLFKSVDILSEIFIYSEKILNIGLVLDIISIARTVMRKKNILINYIGDKMPLIIWHVLNISKFYNLLNADLHSLTNYLSKSEDLYSKFDALNFFRRFYLNPEYTSQLGLDNLTQEKVESILAHPNNLYKKELYIFKLFSLLKNNWDEDVFPRLDFMSVTMKATSLYSILEKETFVKKEIENMWQFNTLHKWELSWDKVKYFLSIPANSDLYCTVIRSKWNQITLDEFNLVELNKMKKILRLLLLNINQENVRRRRVSLSLRRKHSADELEKMIDQIEGANMHSRKVKLISPKNQVLIGEIINAVKACFLYEDRNSQSETIGNDYARIMDLASSILNSLSLNKEMLKFSPQLITSIIELLRVDMGCEMAAIPKILDFAEDMLLHRRTKYLTEREEIRTLELEKYNELIVDMLEVVDALFVEPNKSYYLVSISQYARLVSTHSIWQHVVSIPEEKKTIFDSLIVLLDDILTEMPENLVNPTLENLKKIGVIDKLIDHFLEVDYLDFETIGFYLLMMTKFMICPYKDDSFEERLKQCLKKAFVTLAHRDFVKQNIRRFQGADSTNAVVVLADELIDLVNVKYSLKSEVAAAMDLCLGEMELFYSMLGAQLPKIVKNTLKY